MKQESTKSSVVSCIKPQMAPAWSARVDRWTQLDDACFTFCEALQQWNFLSDLEKPEFIFVVLPNASNEADFDFVSSGAGSPSKFVFTLPNICASVLFQLIQFSGRTFCLSKGAESLEFAKTEANEFLKRNKTSWVFSNQSVGVKNERQVQFFAYTNNI